MGITRILIDIQAQKRIHVARLIIAGYVKQACMVHMLCMHGASAVATLELHEQNCLLSQQQASSKLVRLNACRFTYSIIIDDATGAEKGLYEALHRPGVPGAQPGKSGSPPPHLHRTQTECFTVR